ncbi:MAG: HEAT repeat domain-containing protein [Acidimicrobiales bacterium]
MPPGTDRGAPDGRGDLGLGLRHPIERRVQAVLAGHRGDVAAARLALGDPEPAVRSSALGALVRLDDLRAEDVDAGLDDPARQVRARAAEVAAKLGSGAVASLVRALGDQDGQVVESACFALGEVGPRALATGGRNSSAAAVPALAAVATSHADPLCREAAVAALGAIGDPAGLSAVLTATSDKPAVRRRAVLALAPFSGGDVDAALERALSDRDWQVRQAAEDLVGRGGPAGDPSGAGQAT